MKIIACKGIENNSLKTAVIFKRECKKGRGGVYVCVCVYVRVFFCGLCMFGYINLFIL